VADEAEEQDLRWYRVTAAVQASSAEEAEALVARALPAQHEGSLTGSHVNMVEEIRWYVATVSMPPPEQSWCTAVLGVDPAEVRAFLEQDFEPEQIGEIELLMPPDEDVPLEDNPEGES
jgi:hypothetical protein